MMADTTVTLTPETDIPQANFIEVGQSLSMQVLNVWQAQTSNPAKSDVACTPGAVGSVSTTGKSAGIVSTAYGTSNGTVAVVRYQITDKAHISAYTEKYGGEVTFSGAGVTKQSPVVVTAGGNNITWRSLDTAVATVDASTGAITSVGNGAAIVLGEFTDEWGKARDIHVLVGVGVQLGDAGLGQLLALIAQAAAIMALSPNPYTTESLETLQTALDNGKKTVDGASVSDSDVQAAIKGLQDALDALSKKPTRPDNIVGPDSEGKYYSPLGDPKNTYEVVDADGNPASQPPSYVYNADGDPTNGKNRPALSSNGFYYVEDPAGSNLWKQVGKDGTLTASPAQWGGPDGTLGGTDDKAVTLFGDGYWVSDGQNVWQQVTAPTTLGPLTGGGGDENPASTPALPITGNGGQYYVGPLGPDSDGNRYYYGDKASGGDGKVESTPESMAASDDKYYLVNGQMTTTKPGKPITDTPNAVDGRVLTDAQTGDGPWVELAQNGDYSLIVRGTFINTYSKTAHLGEAEWNVVNYADGVSVGVAYQRSTLRDVINSWFNPDLNAPGFAGNKLPSGVRLRRFTVKNNAVSETGTQEDITSGLSTPQSVPDPTGLDVSFALSYGEAVNYCSVMYYPSGTASNATAKANFGKLTVPANTSDNTGAGSFWLRTLGNDNNASAKPPEGTTCTVDSAGYAFQEETTAWGAHNRSSQCLVFPALWVSQGLFAPE